jgi:hypothetical protein
MDKARRPALRIRLSQWAARHVDRFWLPPVVAGFPAADFFVPVMPNQLLLIGLSALAPRRWPVFALAFAAGTASGGMAIAYAVQFVGVAAAGLAGTDEAADAVAEITRYLRLHGLWYLAAIALLPWTPRLTVVACAMVGIHPLAILVTLFFARLVPSAALAMSGAFGLQLAKRSVLLQQLSIRIRELLRT